MPDGTDDEKAKERIKDMASAYHAVFTGKYGDIVLDDLKRSFFFNSSTMVAGYPDVTAKNEGSREAVLKIVRMLDIAENPEKYLGEVPVITSEEPDEPGLVELDPPMSTGD
jgi:hypothetical protein